MTEEYQKSGPKSPKAQAKERERELQRALSEALKIKDEELFKERIRVRFGITVDDPRYESIISIWRLGRDA